MERENRTLLDLARTQLIAKKRPKYLWAEATSTAVYLANRVLPSARSNNKTAYEVWKRKPDVHHVHPFGCEAFVYVPKILTKKLDSRSKKMFLVGYEIIYVDIYVV